MAAGSIVLDLLLRTGSFSTDTNRAAKDLTKLKREAYATGKALGDSFKNVAGALGITLTVAGLVSLVKSSIDAADHLRDLSQSTGIAVETLGGIGFAATQAGADLDSAAQALGKLNLKIASAAGGDKESVALFKAMGISVLDAAGKAKSADEVFAELADRFNEYADGPEKAALGNAIFGKSYAQIIPLLNDGGKALRENVEFYKRYSGVTQEVADKADQFNDTVGKLSLLTGAFGQQIAAELLPSLQSVVGLFLKSAEEGTGFGGTVERIGTAIKNLAVGVAFLGSTLLAVGEYLGAFGAQAGALLRGDIEGAKEIGRSLRRELDDIKKGYLDFRSAIYDPKPVPGPTTGDFARADRNDASKPKGRAPGLPGAGDRGDPDKGVKAALEAEVKAIREFGRERVQAYEFANKYVEGVYQDGTTSLRETLDTQKRLREASLQSEKDALDDEIDALLARANNPKLKPETRKDIDQKIADAVAKREAVGNEAARNAVLNAQEEERAGKTEQLSRARADYNTLLDQARDKEEAILLAAQARGDTELETLRAVGAAREQSLEQLGRLATQAQTLADELKTPEAIAFAAQLANAFKRASLEVDPLLTKTRGVAREMGDSIAGAFEGAMEPGQKLREVLKGIYDDILRILNRKLITEPISDSITNVLGGTGESAGLLGPIFGAGKGKVGAKGGEAASSSGTRALDEKSTSVATSLLSLQTQGIEPAIAALLRFRSVLDGTPQPALAAAAGSTTGDFARMDRALGGDAPDEPTTGDFSRADRASDQATAEASARSIQDLGTGALKAASVVEQLAQAAGKGSSALSLLPSIIRAIDLAGLGSSAGTGGGWAGLVSTVGSFFTGGSSGGSTLTTGDFSRMDRMHDGGVVGRDWLQTDDRTRSAALKPNERRAVLEVGEEVITRDDPRHRDNAGATLPGERKFHDGGVVGRAVGGVFSRSSAAQNGPMSEGGMNVQIVNNGAPATATARTERGPDGRQLLKITMKAIEADIAAGGRVGKAMEGQYGLRRNLPRRD